jgi:hypothetical protein
VADGLENREALTSASGTTAEFAAPAIVEVFRDTPEDIQDRWVRIYVDDEPEAILRYGETLRRELPPGRHRIKAHNTLSHDTINVDLAPGQRLRVRCHNHFARGGVIMMLTIGFSFITCKLEVVSA